MSPGCETRARALLRAYHDRGDRRARDELVKLYFPLVHRLASRYRHRADGLDDLVQIGVLGLLSAIERYRPERGSSFEAFAAPTVAGELRRHERDRSWPVRVPRRWQELRRELEAARADLASRLGRSPTCVELARAVGAPQADVERALATERTRRPVSLSSPSPFDERELLTLERQEAEDTAARAEARVLVATGLRRLDRRARRIVHLRFYEGKSQAQIAAEVELSQIHVSRVLRDSLEALRRQLEATPG